MIDAPKLLVFVGFIDIYKWLIRNCKGAVYGPDTSKQMAKYFKAREKECIAAIECIKAHPDWDDERVAEEIDWDE